METITVAQALKAGYTLTKGNYIKDTDDNADRWYWDYRDGVTDHRGKGHRTQVEALEALCFRIVNNAL